MPGRETFEVTLLQRLTSEYGLEADLARQLLEVERMDGDMNADDANMDSLLMLAIEWLWSRP